MFQPCPRLQPLIAGCLSFRFFNARDCNGLYTLFRNQIHLFRIRAFIFSYFPVFVAVCLVDRFQYPYFTL